MCGLSPNPLIRTFAHLKTKWGITGNFQLFLILVVFSITGSLAVAVVKPLLSTIGISSQTMSPWLYYPLRLLIIFPCYQVMLLIVAAVFGQFQFFWNFEKKMFGRFSPRR